MSVKDSSNGKIHSTVLIKAENVTKYYDLGQRKVEALRGVDLEVHERDFAIIYGPSGCGKSTLLHIITGADAPSSGQVFVGEKNIFSLDEDTRGIFRSKKMGIIYQMPYWIKSLNVVKNVALPLIIEGVGQKTAVKQAMELLQKLKIEKFAYQSPTQLSGGEQQRVGLARALISDPLIIIADEPTGNLDSSSSDEIMSFFHSLNVEMKKTIVLVTHNQAYWEMGTKRIEMKDGRVDRVVNHG